MRAFFCLQPLGVLAKPQCGLPPLPSKSDVCGLWRHSRQHGGAIAGLVQWPATARGGSRRLRGQCVSCPTRVTRRSLSRVPALAGRDDVSGSGGLLPDPEQCHSERAWRPDGGPRNPAVPGYAAGDQPLPRARPGGHPLDKSSRGRGSGAPPHDAHGLSAEERRAAQRCQPAASGSGARTAFERLLPDAQERRSADTQGWRHPDTQGLQERQWHECHRRGRHGHKLHNAHGP
mmetsp:Transcript_49844/g.128586  ORF Transcript_49844/g.128586 Transcript_49844/m.128586 type:complete len:232 (-) Transcript_49844:560-1255(-)